MLLTLAHAHADSHNNQNKLPDNLELVLSLSGDSDNIVQAGQELTVNAALRYSAPLFEAASDPYRRWVIPQGSDSYLRISGPGGLIWEEGARRRLAPAAQSDLRVVGFTKLKDEPANSFLRAFDQRTIVTRVSVNSVATLLIYDAWSKELAATVTRPAGTQDSWFGRGHYTNLVSYMTDSVSVWHETESTAWMFVGAARDTVEGLANTGRVHIYRLDWGDRAVEATLVTTLAPPLSEVNNRHSATGTVYYGNSLNLSDDGSTLAVTAMNMNQMGAVYVYTRPDGPGQNWGDIRYADGVKVTPVAIPSHGSNPATSPFNAAALSTCDAYCSRAHSFIANDVEFGSRKVRLSADGRVLVTGATEKRFSMETPGGSFSGAYQKNSKGEVYVWVAPEGGWNAAPRADMDEQGAAKTLIAAKADASSFDPATHYSPGPLRRITEASAVLVERLWTASGAHNVYLGNGVAISPDGATVTGEGTYNSYVFQQSSVAGWEALGERDLNDRYMTPTATLSGLPQLAVRSNTMFSSDGRTMFVVVHGRLNVLQRPATGTWASLNIQTSTEVEQRRNAGDIRQDSLDGSRVVFGDGAATYTSDGGCTVEVADGQATFSCPITLAGATVVVPEGTPEGTFTISGQVTVQQENAADSKVTLRDELQVRIGDVAEVAEAQLGLANDWQGTTDTSDDQPFPTLVEPGGKTRLRLQILNGSGTASGTGSVTSVIVTTTLGGLASLVENGACVGVSAGATTTTCTLPAAALTSNNSDELLLELSHTNKAGAADIWATVVGKQGETLTTERIAIDLTGAPTALAIAPPPTAMLGYAPTDSTDPRNKTTLAVSATDESGNRATVPASGYRAKLTGPDGRMVTSQQAELVWPLRVGDDADDALSLSNGNPQARVTILAGAAAPLEVGEYTLELSAGTGAGKLTATQTVAVTGGAADVALSIDPLGEIGEGASITVTAMVSDASGAAVPDGTPVTFTEGSPGTGVVLVLLSSSRQLTSGGRASVQLQAVSSGNAWVKADADSVAALEVITVAESSPSTLEQAITSLTPGGFSIWTSTQETIASAVYPLLEGVALLSKWNGLKWLNYGVSNGLLLPGSTDFTLARGDILWLAGD